MSALEQLQSDLGSRYSKNAHNKVIMHINNAYAALDLLKEADEESKAHYIRSIIASLEDLKAFFIRRLEDDYIEAKVYNMDQSIMANLLEIAFIEGLQCHPLLKIRMAS